MPFVKNAMDLLIESAEIDLKTNTKSVVKESTVRSGYSSISEASKTIIYGPEVVPVIQVDDGYYTEMNFLYPFMSSNGIKSIVEALNYVAEANNLSKGDVGLLIESEGDVNECINKALESGNSKKKDNILTKISKTIDLSNKLKGNGIKVKKKKSEYKCPKCNKAESACTCE